MPRSKVEQNVLRRADCVEKQARTSAFAPQLDETAVHEVTLAAKIVVSTL